MDSLSNEDCTVIQTTINNTKCLIASCYMDRSDSNCPPDYLPQVVNHAKKHNLALIVGTDANAHHSCWNSPIISDKGRGDQLLDYMAKENLTCENIGSTPTFDNGRWQNIIDLTITNTKGHELLSHWWVDNRDTTINCSDHNFINFKIIGNGNSKTSKFRDISKTDWKLYVQELDNRIAMSDLDTRTISSQEEIDKAGVEFTEIITNAFAASCTEQYISSKARRPPWETKEVREAKNEIKHKLRKARNTKADKDWSDLRSHQAEYKKLVKSARTTTWKTFCHEMDSKSNSKKISTIVKNNKTSKLGTVRDPNGKLTESPEETLEILTQTHFKDCLTVIDNNAQPNPPCPVPPASTNMEKTVWEPAHIFSERRVGKAIAEFDPLSAAGPDGIRPVMLQKGWSIIGSSLTNIIRSSYVNSLIPLCWKNSTGIFLPKPGKTDYYDPKSYRTITLSPVPLKLVERVVQWHMEADLNMEKVLHKNQFGFRKGLSTEAALHSIVNKIENQILKGEYAMGTFLDIEGAFDNVSFKAISRALEKYCPSTSVNNWINTLIKSRSTTVELNGEKRTVISMRGTPQGGILSPLLWNLVMNNLFSFTRDKIPCDLQGFADDLLLMARGTDADTLRDVTQRSIYAIEEWCRENELSLSHEKTHIIMFTRKQKWKLARPIKVNGKTVELRETTKFLGVTLDQKLTWTPHIVKQAKKAKGVLMMCKNAIGPTWGFTPATMKWIYTSIVRPMVTYAAAIWVNGLRTQKNIKVLSSIQRLSHLMVTGGHPSTPLKALDKLLGFLPIETYIKEQATTCAARLMATDSWIIESDAATNGRLRKHSSIIDEIHRNIPFYGCPMDLIKPQLNLDPHFEVVIPPREDFPAILDAIPSTTIQCYTDGSGMEEQTGAGFVIYKDGEVFKEDSFHLGNHSTVFQAEVTAVTKVAAHLLETKCADKNITIFCDSQAAITALDSSKLKTKTSLEAVQTLDKLGMKNNLRLSWVPAHSDFEGNEKADVLAKQGCLKEGDFTNLELPIPQAVWKSNIHLRARKEADDRWESSPTSHFKSMWRDKFQHDTGNLNRGELRIATQLLTGHAGLNYHLHKYKPNIISKTCPFCQDEDETVNHYLGACPRWSSLRAQYLNTYYDSSSNIMDNSNLKNIIHFAKASRRLDIDFVSPDRLPDPQPDL
jgi:ribonuclease HI